MAYDRQVVVYQESAQGVLEQIGQTVEAPTLLPDELNWGAAIALQGNRLVVTADQRQEPLGNPGESGELLITGTSAVVVYEYDGVDWSVVGEPVVANDYLGRDVALVGQDRVVASTYSHIHVLEWNGVEWDVVQTLDVGRFDRMAVSPNGMYIAALREDSVQMFEDTGVLYEWRQTLDEGGHSVAIDQDGTLAIGVTGPDAHVQVHRLDDGSTWQRDGRAFGTATDFGWHALALSEGRLVGGAPYDRVDNTGPFPVPAGFVEYWQAS